MEGDTFSGLGNGTQLDGKVLQSFQKSFVQVQNILDQNRLLINEINQNHESKIPDNLGRNATHLRQCLGQKVAIPLVLHRKRMHLSIFQDYFD
ncbi:hypothetical protein CDL12_09181 [Handroanthus impetiginosus]|uniref:Protein EARLY FLOWERING 4 domain-containing protein n=1 Tax=Handroanthus impetiginosus TaxID=429701 RepID=A0A2G9HKU3_9LAMI|nr:hypothetical protein CDL12_09181 [Handroanthus impetiginosus]